MQCCKHGTYAMTFRPPTQPHICPVYLTYRRLAFALRLPQAMATPQLRSHPGLRFAFAVSCHLHQREGESARHCTAASDGYASRSGTIPPRCACASPCIRPAFSQANVEQGEMSSVINNLRGTLGEGLGESYGTFWVGVWPYVDHPSRTRGNRSGAVFLRVRALHCP